MFINDIRSVHGCRIAILRDQLRLRNDHLSAQRARLPEEHQELRLGLTFEVYFELFEGPNKP